MISLYTHSKLNNFINIYFVILRHFACFVCLLHFINLPLLSLFKINYHWGLTIQRLGVESKISEHGHFCAGHPLSLNSREQVSQLKAAQKGQGKKTRTVDPYLP
jgi:hypothetical protein